MKMLWSPSSQLIVLVASLLWFETTARPYLVIFPSRQMKCVYVELKPSNMITVEYELLEYSLKDDTVEINMKPKSDDDDDNNFYDKEPDDDHARISARTQVYKVLKKSGTIYFKTDHHHSNGAEICVNISKKMNWPVYISLQVIETAVVTRKDFFDDDYMIELDLDIRNEKEKSKDLLKAKSEETEDQNKGHAHMNYIEKTIFNMLRETSFLQNNVEGQRKAEAKFFQKSKYMHQSIKRWPIIHLVVLIVTGFLQAKHMMNFFKSRRLM